MSGMVMTVLETHVPEGQWAALVDGFARMQAGRPSQLSESFLVQGSADPTLWQVVGLWRSRDALNEYRASVEAPGGVVLLRSVGSEPTLSVFEVRAQ
ncbi:MAG TPA: hypothetical protein VE338_19480 [Ktedonobacterales bacterium]|jgi:hypothetical protein|nr:hypothetical protein [Ktedonobacterales bacterium]